MGAYDAVLEQFDVLGERYRFEIIFTDNHSDDGTEQELEKLAARDNRVKVIRFARNFGFQKSLLTAYRQASGAAAIQIDCDLQDPPALIPQFLKLWEDGHDVVIGIRRKREESRSLSLFRRLYYKIVTSISEDNIIENAGDFRLVDRQILDQLRQINDTHPYTRGIISSLAARQTGITYDRKARQHGKSKFPLRRLTGFAADGIVSHSMFPLRIATYAGLLVFLVAIAISIYVIGGWLIFGREWPVGYGSVVLLLLISIGLNGIFIGVVGEYVGRIYNQVRVRPTTIVERTINTDQDVPSNEPGEKL